MQTPLPRIIYNDDSCSLREIDPPHRLEQIEQAVTHLVGSQVDRVCWCFGENGLAFAWTSAVLDSFNHLAAQTEAAREAYLKRSLHYAMEQQGIDYVPHLIRAFREAGKEFYASFRMNDCHCKSEPKGPLATRHWREHQHLRLWGVEDSLSYFNAALDYSYPEVRDVIFTAVAEVVERYDVDGIELDFLRNDICFQPEEAWEKRGIMTEFFARIRACLQQKRGSSGRPPGLMVRIPIDEGRRRRAGLDLATWLEQGLVDLVVGSARLNGYRDDVRPMAALCRAHGVPFYGGIEIFPRINPQPTTQMTCDQKVAMHNHGYRLSAAELEQGTCGLAERHLEQGADGVYLFNFPCWRSEIGGRHEVKQTEAGDAEAFDRLLRTCGDLATLKPRPKRYYYWDQLPIYAEALRPERYFQTLIINLTGAVGPGERFVFCFRCFGAQNPHATRASSGFVLGQLLRVSVNGVPIGADRITITAQAAGKVPSGYTLGEHDLWQVEVAGAALREGDNRLSFFMPDEPEDNTPYIYIHDLQVLRYPDGSQG